MILHIKLKDKKVIILHWTETNEAEIKAECLKYPEASYILTEDDGEIIESGELNCIFG